MKAATTEVTSSHVPTLSKPDVVLDVIRKAASTVSGVLIPVVHFGCWLFSTAPDISLDVG